MDGSLVLRLITSSTLAKERAKGNTHRDRCLPDATFVRQEGKMRPLFYAAMTAWTLLLFTLASAAFAAPPAPAIPEPLRPWMTWARAMVKRVHHFMGIKI